MFDFVKQDSLSSLMPVTNEDISRIEKKFSIVFPDILKEYYLKYNGMYIHTVELSYDDGEITGVGGIIPVITNEMIDGTIPDEYSVECIKENELNEPYNRVLPNLIPFAINEGGDYYYWDTKDGKVYISFNADEDENGTEIPYYICSSVDEMFRLMSEEYEKEMRG